LPDVFLYGAVNVIL